MLQLLELGVATAVVAAAIFVFLVDLLFVLVRASSLLELCNLLSLLLVEVLGLLQVCIVLFDYGTRLLKVCHYLLVFREGWSLTLI